MKNKNKKLLAWGFIIIVMIFILKILIQKILLLGFPRGLNATFIGLIPGTIGPLIITIVVIWLVVVAIKTIRRDEK